MQRPRHRKWAFFVGGLILLGGLGFVQSRGGLAEVMKMPAKLDASTPAFQDGFELIGVERTTEKERSPLLTVGETAIGGGLIGPVGSTRIWFRLPPARGRGLGIPGDDELKAYVGFPNGERYLVRWEMGDLGQRIVTLLIPGGYPPSQWMEIHLEGTLGRARWRLQRIPQTPYALPKAGSAAAEGEGMKVTASGVTLARKELGVGLGESRPETLRIDFTVDPPSPERGKGTRLIWESFIPEYQHPADQAKPGTLGIITSGERKDSVRVAFAYGDLMRHVAAKGRFEAWEPVRAPAMLKNVRWTKEVTRQEGNVLYFRADRAQLGDGSFLSLEGLVPVRAGELSGKPTFNGYCTPPLGKEREAHRYRSVADPIQDATVKSWESRLKALAKSSDPAASVSLGSVSIMTEYYRVIRTTPFELLVPVRPGSQKEMAQEKVQATEIGRERPRPIFRSRAPRIELKSKAVVVE